MGVSFNVDLLQSVVAGWIAGAVAGLAGTAVLLIFVARRPEMAQRLPLQNHLVVLGIVFANGLVIGLTLIGILAGAAHYRFGGGPGSAFSVGVVVVAALVSVVYVLVRRGFRAEVPGVLICLGIVALTFSLLLPWLGTMDR